MTCQYLIGELSVRLQELQALAGPAESEVARLRAEVEACPVSDLGYLSLRAVALADGLCWVSVARDDMAAFDAQSRMVAELRQFAVGTRLLSRR